MSVLGKKLLRDFARLKGQVVTIALVLACGVMAILMLRSTYASLLLSRDAYYAEQRFGEVFAHLQRAPASLAGRLAQLPGVREVYPRIVEDVMVPLASRPDPVTGRIVSIPDDGPPPQNGLVLTAGRLPAKTSDEIVILEQFARAAHVRIGDGLPVVLSGALRRLTVVGMAMSPEYVFAASGTEVAVDETKFVVIWMRVSRAAPAFDMAGAFNDLSLRLQPGAAPEPVLASLDRALAPYGGIRAYARDKQPSNAMLDAELGNLHNLSFMIPAVFLAVAAFLVNMVLSRLVFLERTQIAILKALGFANRTVGAHYLGLVALVVLSGTALGVGLGVWSGRWMTGVYTRLFRFPSGAFVLEPALLAGTWLVASLAGTLGALGSVYRVVRLPPAQAMRPPAPLSYRRSRLLRLDLGRWSGQATTMVAREIGRRPFRFLMSVAGIATGTAIFVMGHFSWDSFAALIYETYPREHREDLTVTFDRAVDGRAVEALAHLPGVVRAEGLRAVPVRFRAGPRWRNSAILGLPESDGLRRVLDGPRGPLELPPSGVVLTDKLAEILEVRPGDVVRAEILEGDFSERPLRVAGLVNQPFGLQAFADARWLASELRETPRVSQVGLRIEADRDRSVRAALKTFPAVIGVARTDAVVRNFEQQTGEILSGVTAVLALSAAAIAIGVVYNNARIALSLRSRDLASLRVLGFTRGEIAAMLLGELALQVVLGVPLGLLLGTAWGHMIAASFNPEAIRLPVHISAQTYATSALIAFGSGLLSALFMRRRLDALDLIGVLKASE